MPGQNNARRKAELEAAFPQLTPKFPPYQREQIRVRELVDRLTRCGLGQVEMTPSAVTAAIAVLKKALPDLTSVEVKGDTHDRVRIYAEVPRPIADLNEWMKGNPVKQIEAEVVHEPQPKLQGILSLEPVEEDEPVVPIPDPEVK